MSGWGDVSNGLFSGTSDLHKMTVPLLDLPACNETLRPLLTKWRLLPLSDVNLCTGPGETNDVSVCVVSEVSFSPRTFSPLRFVCTG